MPKTRINRNRTGNPNDHTAFGGYLDVVLWGAALVNCWLSLHTCLHMLVGFSLSLVIIVTRGESMFIELECQNLYAREND